MQLYAASGTEVGDAEREAMFPILASLQGIDWRYAEASDLAVGGMKKISLVSDLHTRRRVVYAEPLDTATDQDIERFLYEARITASLEHPNIVPVHDMGLTPEGKPFFTMKLIEGSSLSSILRRVHQGDEAFVRQFDLDSLLDILVKVCDAVAYAHSKEVLHLDIKSGNVQVGRYGDVQLCDWGLAQFNGDNIDTFKSLGSEVGEGATMSGRLKGTPGFMAPELCVTDWTATAAVDIYALGALLYEILTGLAPVEGDGVTQVLERTRAGQVIPPHKRCRGKLIPRSLSAVAMKALAVRPEDRYASVADFQQELIRYMRGFSTIAEEAGTLKLLQLLYRRNPIRFNIFFTALAVILVLTIGFVVKVRHEKLLATRARDEAVQNLQMFLDEQHRRELLEMETQELVELVRGLSDYSSAELLVELMNRALDRTDDPVERKVLYAKKGLLHFVLEEFNAALTCYENLDDKDIRLIDMQPRSAVFLKEIWKEFASIKPDDRIPLTEDQLVELTSRFHGNRSDEVVELLCYTYYHHRRRVPCDDPEHCLQAIISMLDRINYYSSYGIHRITEDTLTPYGDGYRLNLSGHPYQTFKMPIGGLGVDSVNLLVPLKLKSLDLSDSAFSDFNNLTGVKLEELILLGIKLPEKYWELRINKFKNLKRVVVDQNCPASLIEGLREHDIEVEVRIHPLPRKDAE